MYKNIFIAQHSNQHRCDEKKYLNPSIVLRESLNSEGDGLGLEKCQGGRLEILNLKTVL